MSNRVGALTTPMALATLCACLTGVAAAQTSAPATQPAATVPSDSMTPRGAVKAFLLALDAGDADAVRATLQASSPLEEKMVDVMARRAGAERAFRNAVDKAYGAAGARMLVRDNQAALAASLARLDSAREQVDGDSATVAGEGDQPEEALRLKRQGAVWKLPVSQFTRAGDDPHEVEKALEDQLGEATLFTEVAQQVAAGAFKSPEEVAEEIRTRMMVQAARRAASGPVTPGDASPAGAATKPQ